MVKILAFHVSDSGSIPGKCIHKYCVRIVVQYFNRTKMIDFHFTYYKLMVDIVILYTL